MSEFVRKATIGYKVVPGGHGDPALTHVILTKEEYEDLLAEIQKEKKKAAKAALDAKKRVQEVTDQSNMELQKIQETTEQTIGELREEVAAEREEKEYQQRLNANLLRISKERANASRKLQPKKEHSGYVVISSMEKDHSYKYGSNRRTVRLWETVLQTPFSIDFTEEQARTETEKLFQKDETGMWPIGKIGINGQYLDGYGEMIRDRDAAEWKECNVIVEKKLRANFRAGYWEQIVLHTKPLGVVPAEMRP